jgi:Na+-driven multidrug efflux pump
MSIKVTTYVATGSFLVMMLWSRPLLRLFTSDRFLIMEGGDILRILILMYPLFGFHVVGATLFQAIGKAGPALLLNMARQVLFLIPLLLTVPRFMGLNGIWISFPVADLCAILVTFVWVMREVRLLKNHSEMESVQPYPA